MNKGHHLIVSKRYIGAKEREEYIQNLKAKRVTFLRLDNLQGVIQGYEFDSFSFGEFDMDIDPDTMGLIRSRIRP